MEGGRISPQAPSPGRREAGWGWRGVSVSESLRLSTPDLFTAGTIGPAGQRRLLSPGPGRRCAGDAQVREGAGARPCEYLGKLLERSSTPAATAGGADLALIRAGDAGLDRGVDRRRLRRDGGPRGAGDRRGPGAGTRRRRPRSRNWRRRSRPPRRSRRPSPREESGAAGGDRASGRVRLTRAQVAAFVERARSHRGGPAHLPVLRPPDEPRRTPVRPHERARLGLVPGDDAEPPPSLPSSCSNAARSRSRAGSWASNATFLVKSPADAPPRWASEAAARERPLWDFPRGSTGARWPRTSCPRPSAGAWCRRPWSGTVRTAPARSSCSSTPTRGALLTLREWTGASPRWRVSAPSISWQDNADRKSGHCLLGRDGHLYAIDNGLCFHVEPKLRTVVWDLAGEPIPAEIRTVASRLGAQGLPESLARLLAAEERAALQARARALGSAEQFPEDATGMRYPWPLV